MGKRRAVEKVVGDDARHEDKIFCSSVCDPPSFRMVLCSAVRQGDYLVAHLSAAVKFVGDKRLEETSDTIIPGQDPWSFQGDSSSSFLIFEMLANLLQQKMSWK